jgi:anti-sigma B factor antagonist
MSRSLSHRHTSTTTAVEPAKPWFTLTIVEGVAFVHAQGEIDLANADNLRALGEDAISDFVGTIRIDLAQITFMDSSGLAALIAIRNAALDAGRVLILERPAKQVRRVLEVTGLDTAFRIED